MILKTNDGFINIKNAQHYYVNGNTLKIVYEKNEIHVKIKRSLTNDLIYFINRGILNNKKMVDISEFVF